ncbi:MAG TPA: pitrilysin family protein, partial [Bdellovibrionales bacterium]|nr:pitrilysin family protein [Bdellovibrionales bacterium]
MKTLNLLIALVLFAGCATKPAQTKTGSEAKTTKLRPFTEKTLSNGLRVLLVDDKSLPYITYGLMLKTGAAADPTDQKGLTHFVASLLEKGAGSKTATQIADELGFLGAGFNVSVDEDFVYLSTSGLSSSRDKLLDMFSDIVTSPTFAQNEIERMRKQVLAHLVQRKDEPDTVAELAFKKFLFGEHPYGYPVLGRTPDVKAIKRKDLIRHYLQHYRPNNAILAVTGQYGADILAQLEAKFKDWKQREVQIGEVPEAPAITSVQIELVEKPELSQTQIMMGHSGISRNNPDYLTVRVANTILGTGFSSRLVNQIRDNLGLTYSISSDFDGRRGTGPFVVSTFTRHEKVKETLSETLRLLAQFRDGGVTENELAVAKGYLRGHFLRSIETAEKLSFNLL